TESNKSDDKKTELNWEEKHAELNDSHLRLMAEFDNYRKRTLREKAELIKTGGEGVIINLLPVIDDFERALDTIRPTEDIQAVIQGIELIYAKFISYLSQQGVKVIETKEQLFNTELYEAVAVIPTTDADMKGKIIDCIQTGYTIYDKVIRHAKVVVGE
ncbi:MAG: nucleotide exchange factor GrpE, partial [Tannerella sp.]|nr:nucleotide exchange factor GrpE [Tannerella sp.]